MNLTICPAALWPTTLACGGGRCVNATHCKCPLGWSGYSDFTYGAPNCLSNDLALDVLWGLACALHALITLPLAIEGTHRAFRQARSKRNHNVLKKFYKRFTIHFNASILAQCVTVIALALLKIIAGQADAQIGTSVSATFLYFTAFVAYSLSAVFFLRVFLDLNINNAKFRHRNEHTRRVVDAAYSALRRVFPLLLVFILAFAVAPLAMLGLGAGNPDAVYYLGLVHAGGTALLVAAYSQVFAPLLMRPVSADISALLDAMPPGQGLPDAEKDRLRLARDRIVYVMRMLRAMGVLAAAPTLAFALWPFLRSGFYSYFVAVAWIVASGTSTALLFANQPTDRALVPSRISCVLPCRRCRMFELPPAPPLPNSKPRYRERAAALVVSAMRSKSRNNANSPPTTTAVVAGAAGDCGEKLVEEESGLAASNPLFYAHVPSNDNNSGT